MHVPTIHRIRIERFRRIQEPLELDFTAPKGDACSTVVLAGPNGSGKTSILEAVLLGLKQERLIVRDEEKSRREEHWRTVLPQGAQIDIDLSLDGGPLQRWKRTWDAFEAPSSRAPVEPDGVLAVEYFSSWRTPELVGAVKPLIGRGGRPRDNESNRLWRLKQRVNDERARAGYPQPSFPGINKADEWLEAISKAWKRFHADDGTSIDAQIADPNDEELLADLYVIKDGKRVCSIDQVSSGELELLSFAGWIILNGFDGGLLVIDEPELHLHPQWQSTFLPALRELSPKTQFLVASHSSAVWDQAYSFERFMLFDRGSEPRPEQAATGE